MLISRDNQICLEFAFWKSRPPVALGGIYEMRTYLLKVFHSTIFPFVVAASTPWKHLQQFVADTHALCLLTSISPVTFWSGRPTGAVVSSADANSVSPLEHGSLSSESLTMSTTCGTTRTCHAKGTLCFAVSSPQMRRLDNSPRTLL